MELLTVVAGMVLRLALPAAVTLAAAWLLRGLDARWQAQAAAQAGAQALHATRAATPCWVTHNCPPERRAACPAFGQSAVPCWQIHRDARGNLRADCLTCSVLLQAPVARPA